MRFSKKALALVMSVVTVVALMVGTLAYFTDRFDASVSATAGTLDLTTTGITVVAEDAKDLKPGYGVPFSITVSNAGNKSADVLETLVLTVTKSGAAKNMTSATPEFSIYPKSAVTMDANNVVTATSGDDLGSVSGNKIIYNATEFILNGSGANAETETGAKGTSLKTEYVLVFNKTAGNDFQGLSLTLDYEAQAKQHRNTNSTAWTSLKTETVTFAGDTAYKAVPTKG